MLHHLEKDWRKETEKEQQVRQEGNQERDQYPGIQVMKAFQEGIAIKCVNYHWEDKKDGDYALAIGFGNMEFNETD